MKEFFALLWMALLCCVCVSALADTTSEGLEYTIHGTYVEITGYTGTVIQLTVPETINGIPVTHIAAEAFSGTTSVYKITLPEGLLSIGEDAFYGCKNLAAVNLPSTLQSLGEYAFAECSNLSGKITIPEGITTIPNGAFNGCKWLTTVNLPNTMTSLGIAAFGNCTALKNITLPVGLKSIGQNAFYGCESLTSLYFPYTLTSIQAGAFMNCSNLTGLIWPLASQLVAIGESAFSGCTSITAAKIPEGVTAIKQSTFSGCTSLNNVTLPSGLISIASNAFSGCTALMSLTIPESVTSISDSAFLNCTALTHTVAPGSYADNWCIRNSSMYADLFTYEQTDEGKVITGYTGTGGSIYIPSHFVGIGYEAFKGNTKITSLYIPGNVKTVGAWAFYQCDNMTNVRMESGVETLREEAFSSCDNLISINIPDTVTALGSHTFYATYSLESISLPDSITTIPDNCFSQANKLKSVKLPANLTSIGKYAFNATALEQITIPETVTSIGDYAFITCLKLQEVSIPKNVTSIGVEAFRGCTALKKITILENVTSIGEDAFEGCTDELVIYGMTGSRAQSYAAEYDITFVALDAAELAAPQNPSWKEGSTATAIWDAVEGADYYELTVYVYDEAGAALLGSTTTGTSATEVDVQLETNIIINQQETKHTAVQIAYTIKAGVTGDDGTITYGAESAMSAMWKYEFALIKLQPPKNVVLNEDGTASWDAVEGASSYTLYFPSVYYRPTGIKGTIDENGAFTCDLTSCIEYVYSLAVKNNQITAGDKMLICIQVQSCSGNSGLYTNGDFSSLSNTVEYVGSIIKLNAPENVVLNENGTASWNAVEGADSYTVYFPTVYYRPVGIKGIIDENGIFTCDLTSHIEYAYSLAVESNMITAGDQMPICIQVQSCSNNTAKYADSDFSPSSNTVEYSSGIIKLDAPGNVVLNEDGTASWIAVDGADSYTVYFPSVYYRPTGIKGTIDENGIFTCDLIKYMERVYSLAVERNMVTAGNKLSICIQVQSCSNDSEQYADSDFSSSSNVVDYSPFTPVESITLYPSQPVLYVGNSYYLGKTITPEDGYYTTIDWSSTNTGVVTVNEAGLITGVAEGKADVTAAIGDVADTVPVMVYTISSNVGDQDKDHVTDSAGSIIDDIVNNENPDISDTDIPEENLGDIRDEVYEGIWRGDEFFTDMKWYKENFEKYKDNWGQIQKAARQLNAQFAGAYNIEVEMYHKDKDGANHVIGCIEEFENEITFAFDLPTGMDEIQSGYARKYVLVRVHRGEIETIDVEVNNGQCTAKSDSFSDFILLYVDEPVGAVDLTGLKTLTLPSSLVVIEDEAFIGIAAEVVIIPENCTSIGSRAFAGCMNLKYIVLPLGSDITPANDAFEGCNAVILYK